MTATRTLVGTPDRDPNRQARLEWVASTLRSPLARTSQAARRIIAFPLRPTSSRGGDTA